MPAFVVFLAYGSSLALALYLLYRYHSHHWYWHVLSVALAIGTGFVRFPPHPPAADMLIGMVLVFLFAWGVAAPFFHVPHLEKHV